MTHSHLAIRHFIRELELRGRRPPTMIAPAWLKTFLGEVAELFDPAADTARAGYECCRVESGWAATLFLGRTEMIGGPQDGEQRDADFQFDLLALSRRFDEVHSIDWKSTNSRSGARSADASFVTLTGMTHGELLVLKVSSAAPESLAPGLRMHGNGRYELQ